MRLPLVPPFRYTMVEENLHKGAYPTLKNFRFLRRLKLKSIITCTPEPPTRDLLTFCRLFGIQHHYFEIEKQSEGISLSTDVICQILQIYTDPKCQPSYLHCLDGTKVTALIVACLRRLQNWKTSEIETEMARWTEVGSATTKFIESFSSSSEDELQWIEGRMVGPLLLGPPSRSTRVSSSDDSVPGKTKTEGFSGRSMGAPRPLPGPLMTSRGQKSEGDDKSLSLSFLALNLEGAAKFRKYGPADAAFF